MEILNFDTLFIILICLTLASITYYKGLLNIDGAVTAFFMALFIGFQGSITFILLLVIFLLSAFLATRYEFGYKKKRGIQQGLEGERGWKNVVANGAVPTAILVLSGSGAVVSIGFLESSLVFPLFVASIAAAASDTLASEMGMVSDKTYLITNLRKVEPGTNGGVSLYGELWALIGAVYTFFVAQIMFYFSNFPLLSLIVIILGTGISFLSCQFDSIFGATLERKGVMSKSMVNFTSISISMIIYGGILWQIGY
ncbi:MAG: DUF92 domain-containing protein [Candidatus Thermoplasmatota archaeon]